MTRAQPESSRSLRRRERRRLKPQGSVWSPDSRLLQHGAGPAWGPLASSPPPKSLGHSGTSDAVSVRRLLGGDIRPQAPHAAECSSPRPPPPRHVLGRVTFRLPVARSPSPSSTWGPRALPDTWSLLGTRVWAGEWVTQARGRWHPAARPCSSAHSSPCPGHTGSAETLSPHLCRCPRPQLPNQPVLQVQRRPRWPRNRRACVGPGLVPPLGGGPGGRRPCDGVRAGTPRFRTAEALQLGVPEASRHTQQVSVLVLPRHRPSAREGRRPVCVTGTRSRVPRAQVRQTMGGRTGLFARTVSPGPRDALGNCHFGGLSL